MTMHVCIISMYVCMYVRACVSMCVCYLGMEVFVIEPSEAVNVGMAIQTEGPLRPQIFG